MLLTVGMTPQLSHLLQSLLKKTPLKSTGQDPPEPFLAAAGKGASPHNSPGQHAAQELAENFSTSWFEGQQCSLLCHPKAFIQAKWVAFPLTGKPGPCVARRGSEISHGSGLHLFLLTICPPAAENYLCAGSSAVEPGRTEDIPLPGAKGLSSQ